MEEAPVEEVVEETAEETPAEEPVEETEGEEAEPAEGEEAEAKPEGPTREQFDAATFKLTVNGKEVEVTGKDLAAAYQRGESGAAKLREAADLRKQVEAKENQLRAVAKELSTPQGMYQALLSMNGDPIAFLQELATIARDEAKLTPEQRELRELRTAKERQEAERKAKEEAERTASEQAEIERVQDAYEDAFEDEMDALGIPEDDEVRDELLTAVGRRAYQLMEAGEDPYVDEIVKEVWEKHQARYQKLFPQKAPEKPAAAPAKKPGIPGTRTAPSKPVTPKSNGRLVYPSGASMEDIRKLMGG